MDQILPRKQVASLLGVSVRFLDAGRGPPYVRLGPRRVGYRLADIQAWLASRTFASRADELAQAGAAPSQE